MFSLLNTIWTVLKTTFRKRATVQYPEERPHIPPRWRGRIILSRDAGGQERCVACNLCAAACPVDCISLQAAEDGHGRRYPSFFRINFSRCIFCGYCEEACPTYAIQLTTDFEMGEYVQAEPGVRKRGPADQRTRQVSRIRFLPRGRSGRRGQGQRRGIERRTSGGCEELASVKTKTARASLTLKKRINAG